MVHTQPHKQLQRKMQFTKFYYDEIIELNC